MADEDVIEGAGPIGLDAPAGTSDLEVATADLDGGDAGTGSVEDAAGASAAIETDSELESLEAFLARNEPARTEYETKVRERENAGAQRREAQLKRDAGKSEITARNVQRFLSEQAIEVEDPRQLHYFYDLAAANAAMELATAVPDSLLRNHTVPVEARERAIEARESGDWDGYVSTLINGAVEAKDAEREAAYDRRVNAEVQKRLAAEIKARGIEAAPVRAGSPPLPGGSASGHGITQQELDAIPTPVFLAKPREEQQRLVDEAKANSARATVTAR